MGQALRDPHGYTLNMIHPGGPFTKALPGFRTSGRRSPFKTAPGGFRAQLMRAGAEGGGASA